MSRGKQSVISTAIYTSQHPSSNVMKWRKLLRVPKKLHRAQSEARSEIDSAEDLTMPRRSESTPDLRIGTSALSTSSPSVPRDQESNGTQAALSQTIHLTALFTQQTPKPSPTEPRPFPQETKAPSRNIQITPSNQVLYLRTNPTGSPPRMLPPS